MAMADIAMKRICMYGFGFGDLISNLFVGKFINNCARYFSFCLVFEAKVKTTYKNTSKYYPNK